MLCVSYQLFCFNSLGGKMKNLGRLESHEGDWKRLGGLAGKAEGKIELTECYWLNLGGLERLSLSTPSPLSEAQTLLCIFIGGKLLERNPYEHWTNNLTIWRRFFLNDKYILIKTTKLARYQWSKYNEYNVSI